MEVEGAWDGKKGQQGQRAAYALRSLEVKVQFPSWFRGHSQCSDFLRFHLFSWKWGPPPQFTVGEKRFSEFTG